MGNQLHLLGKLHPQFLNPMQVGNAGLEREAAPKVIRESTSLNAIHRKRGRPAHPDMVKVQWSDGVEEIMPKQDFVKARRCA